MCKVCTIVYLLEGLLADVPPDKKSSEVMEHFFIFALTWAFGGPMVVDKSDDYRRCARRTNRPLWGSRSDHEHGLGVPGHRRDALAVAVFSTGRRRSTRVFLHTYWPSKRAQGSSRWLSPGSSARGCSTRAASQNASCRKFSEEFLSAFAGLKIPKEGTCFDYYYDWQSDGFRDWATKVQGPLRAGQCVAQHISTVPVARVSSYLQE